MSVWLCIACSTELAGRAATCPACGPLTEGQRAEEVEELRGQLERSARHLAFTREMAEAAIWLAVRFRFLGAGWKRLAKRLNAEVLEALGGEIDAREEAQTLHDQLAVAAREAYGLEEVLRALGVEHADDAVGEVERLRAARSGSWTCAGCAVAVDPNEEVDPPPEVLCSSCLEAEQERCTALDAEVFDLRAETNLLSLLTRESFFLVPVWYEPTPGARFAGVVIARGSLHGTARVRMCAAYWAFKGGREGRVAIAPVGSMRHRPEPHRIDERAAEEAHGG